MKIAIIILVWLVGLGCIPVMKKVDPENKAYGIYVIAVMLMFTLIQFLF